MAIGRTFQESFQKALRGLEVGVDGMNEKTQDRETLEKELGEPGPDRIWYVGDAFAQGFTLEEVHQLTHIDPWFLVQIKDIVDIELWLDEQSLDSVDKALMLQLKQKVSLTVAWQNC
jgi:carbamoyl-phosphate synthase large subunit